MTATMHRRQAASRKAAATRKRLLEFRDIGGPDAAHRGTAKGDYTPEDLPEQLRTKGSGN